VVDAEQGAGRGVGVDVAAVVVRDDDRHALLVYQARFDH